MDERREQRVASWSIYRLPSRRGPGEVRSRSGECEADVCRDGRTNVKMCGLHAKLRRIIAFVVVALGYTYAAFPRDAFDIASTDVF